MSTVAISGGDMGAHQVEEEEAYQGAEEPFHYPDLVQQEEEVEAN